MQKVGRYKKSFRTLVIFFTEQFADFMRNVKKSAVMTHHFSYLFRGSETHTFRTRVARIVVIYRFIYTYQYYIQQSNVCNLLCRLSLLCWLCVCRSVPLSVPLSVLLCSACSCYMLQLDALLDYVRCGGKSFVFSVKYCFSSANLQVHHVHNDLQERF